jgi:hypothetical protein
VQLRVLAGFAVVAAVVLAATVGGGSAATLAAPQNTGQPSISGTTQEGEVLTAGPGQWTNGPRSYRYEWLRCDANGNNCASIRGATGRRYRLVQDDVGHHLRVTVTARNRDGTGTATSASSALITTTRTGPTNTSAPTIGGTPQEGLALTADDGRWNGANPITYAFQWQRCDTAGANCADIAGATGQSYTLGVADVAHTMRVRVTASNARGSHSATSNQTALVAPMKAGGAAISVSSISLPDRLVVDRVSFSPQPIRSRGAFVGRFHVSDTRGFSIQGALVYALGLPYGWVRNAPEVATDGSGWATITLQPTASLPLHRGGAIVIFVRARKPGENLLAGVSTRRLVQASVSRP